MFSSVGQALWVPKGSEVKWDSLVSKVSWGGHGVKDCGDLSFKKEVRESGAQRGLMDMTHKL